MAVRDLHRRMRKPKPLDPRVVAREIKRQKRLTFLKERWNLSKVFFEQNLIQSVK